MATDRLQGWLDEIRALRDDPRSERTVGALRAALEKRPSHVVAAAARHVAEHELRGLAVDLARAYERLAPGLAKSDPGCAAKFALVEALCALEHPDDGPLLHGVQHVQLEKSWGPPVDTAVALRGRALIALVGLGAPSTPLWIAELLADPEARCRSAAARAAAGWGDPVLGQALLRFRVRAGEREPEVLSDCFEGMLRLGGKPADVARHLTGDDVVSESAALALGASGGDDAVPALIGWWTAVVDPESRRVALVAIGLTRSARALAFLLERVATDGRREAHAALQAMAAFVHDPTLIERIADTAREAGLEAELEALR